ncbi:MAG: DMT family transporter [Spirochaetales bacterium]|nr:DMT family transporter [Spirochaetales bacterium]
MKKNKTDSLFILLLIIAMFLWGLSWSVGKVISKNIDTSVLVFWRLFFSFFGLIIILIFNRIIFKNKINLRIDLKSSLFLILSSLILSVYNQLFFRGLETGFAGAGGVLVTTTSPLFTYVFWSILNKKQVKSGAVIGLFLGLAGGLILLEIWHINPDNLLLRGNLFFIIASILWAILTITSEKTQKRISFLTYSFYLYGLSTLFSLIFALPGDISSVLRQDTLFWISLFYLAIPTTALATTLYFFASKKLGSHKASSFTFIVPCAAMLFSFFIHGEIPSIFIIIGGGFSILAIYMLLNLRFLEKNKDLLAKRRFARN